MICISAGNSRHPNCIDKIVGPSVHGKYLNFNCIQYMENNYDISLSPRQENLLTAFQRVIFTQDRSNTSQKSNSLRDNVRFGERKINPRYLTFFVRISFLETNSQQHAAHLAQLPATCAACSSYSEACLQPDPPSMPLCSWQARGIAQRCRSTGAVWVHSC